MANTYFIADLHLNENNPNLTALFRHFIQHYANNAEAVYILGDLFDFWVGDDEHSPLIDEVKSLLRMLTQSGVPCYFCHGNRDFLLGRQFANECGITLLNDYHQITLHGIETLLCHGDTLCTDDLAYQKFRAKVQQKWLQRLFLCLPLSLRVKIAQKIRQRSQQQKRVKSAQIMDVNQNAVQDCFTQFQVKRLIHGHTHRQHIHNYANGTQRIVLGDWGETMSILAISATEVRLFNPTLLNT